MQDNERNTQNDCTSTFRDSATNNATQTTNHAAPLYDLTGFQRDLLKEIVEEGRSGLRIKDAIDESYDREEIHHGRLYPNLTTLADKGLIEKEEADGRTKHYSPTPRGRREYLADLAWRAEAVAEDANVEPISEDVDVVGNGGGSE